MYGRFHILLLMLLCSLSACTPHAVREAKQTVHQSDSLWRAGQPYADSAQLAQAYETLGQWALFCPDDYAHACYHYGKLLRANENPVEAMQCFINATHSRTRDYHILGRVYSNMGDIAHWHGDFPLAYDLFERSAKMFLLSKDTLLYHYGLNNLAYELAEQGKKEKTLLLLDSLNGLCSDKGLLLKTFETKAEMYKIVGQYDSAVYYSHMLFNSGNHELTGLLIRAQAFSYMNERDSAVYYANYILSQSPNLLSQNGALYILTQEDDSKNVEDIRKTSADRSDVQKLIEIQQGKYAQAVQLLVQDLQRKPDWRWLYAIIGTVVIIGIGIFIYVRRKQKRHQLLSQQVKELTTMNYVAMQQYERIMQEHTDYTSKLVSQLEQNCHFFAKTDDFPNNLSWKDFDAMCKLINDNFGMLANKLQSIYHLSEKGVRLCILILMGVTDGKQLARMLFYSERGIRTSKNRLAKKLGTNSIELRNFLINLAINNASNETDSSFVYGSK